MTAKLTKAQTLYRLLSSSDRYADVKWIANVLMTGCGKPARRLAALKALVDAGREVRPMQFTMPYEGLVVDGRALCAMPLLDEAREVPYTSEWYKA